MYMYTYVSFVFSFRYLFVFLTYMSGIWDHNVAIEAPPVSGLWGPGVVRIWLRLGSMGGVGLSFQTERCEIRRCDVS